MRSIPTALVWETFTRGIWILTIPILAVLLWTSALLHLLLSENGLDPSDPSTPMTYRGFMVIIMFVIAASTLGIQGSLSRLSTYPVRTSALVGYQMLIAAVASSLLLILSISLINTVFHIGWPIWSPVLFAMTVVAAFQAALWFAEKTAWLPFTSLMFGLLLGGWFYLRGNPANEIWPVLLPGDFLAAALMLLISYFIGVSGVARNRCGESLKPLGIVAFMQTIIDFRFEVGSKFRSSREAQSWYDWQMMGWNLPLVVCIGQMVWLVTWIIADRSSEGLISGYMAGGFFLCMAGMACGLISGTSESFQRSFQINKRSLQMSQFLASRPISNKEFANSFLKVHAKSVLIGWDLWAGGFLMAIGAHLVTGTVMTPQIPVWVLMLYFPGILLGSWASTASIATLFAAGHTRRLLQLTFGVIALLILVSVIEQRVPEETSILIKNTLLTISGVTILAITCLSFVIAFKKTLISMTTLATSAACWIVLAAFVGIELSVILGVVTPVCILCVGMTSLVVFPIAAAPLAISWNRTR